jgi:hypothetical protein
LIGLLTGNSDVSIKPDGETMEFIDYYAHAKNYNQKIGYEMYPLSKFMEIWALILILGMFAGLIVNLMSMKLYYNMAMRQSTLLMDRLSAMNAAFIKLIYISVYFTLSIIGAIVVRKSN